MLARSALVTPFWRSRYASHVNQILVRNGRDALVVSAHRNGCYRLASGYGLNAAHTGDPPAEQPREHDELMVHDIWTAANGNNVTEEPGQHAYSQIREQAVLQFEYAAAYFENAKNEEQKRQRSADTSLAGQEQIRIVRDLGELIEWNAHVWVIFHSRVWQ